MDARLVTKKLNFSSAGLLALVPALPALSFVPADEVPPDAAPLAEVPPIEVAPLAFVPPLALAPLVFALVPAVGVDDAPLVEAPLAPAVPSPLGSEELQAKTNARTNDAAHDAFANIR